MTNELLTVLREVFGTVEDNKKEAARVTPRTVIVTVIETVTDEEIGVRMLITKQERAPIEMIGNAPILEFDDTLF